MQYLSKNENVDQTFLIKECLTIAGKTTITDALKELEKEGAIEKLIINKLICWNVCALEPMPDEIEEIEEVSEVGKIAVEETLAPVIEPIPAQVMEEETGTADRSLEAWGSVILKDKKPSLKEKLVNTGKKVRAKISIGKTKKKIERPRSQYGRLLSSAVGVIDSLLLAGTTTEDEIINAIQKKFPQKTKQQIVNRMKSHLRQLKKEGVKITEKNGVVAVKIGSKIKK